MKKVRKVFVIASSDQKKPQTTETTKTTETNGASGPIQLTRVVMGYGKKKPLIGTKKVLINMPANADTVQKANTIAATASTTAQQTNKEVFPNRPGNPMQRASTIAINAPSTAQQPNKIVPITIPGAPKRKIILRPVSKQPIVPRGLQVTKKLPTTTATVNMENTLPRIIRPTLSSERYSVDEEDCKDCVKLAIESQALRQDICKQEALLKNTEFEETELKLEYELLQELLENPELRRLCQVCSKQVPAIECSRHICRKDLATLQCDYCPLTFVSVGTLQRHFTVFHGDKECLRCDICSRSYETSLLLEMHTAAFHRIKVKVEEKENGDDESLQIQQVQESVKWEAADEMEE